MFDKEVSTQIIIDAPPSTVRKAFLNVASWDSWNTLVKQVMIPDDKTPETITPGDTMGVTFTATGKIKSQVCIKSNNENEFSWFGTLGSAYIFSGLHFFKFQEEVVDGVIKTKFVHGEHFSGALVPVYFGITGTDKFEEQCNASNIAFKKYFESL